MSIRRSASQLATFRDCQRKWLWQRVLPERPAPNASALLGTETHAQLETYLAGGAFDFTKESGEIAASGLEHLPQPCTPGMELEKEFSFETPAGQVFWGYKDVELTPCNGGVDIPTIIDHKTTSDLKWQKTETDLRSDPQAILYAVDAFSKNPESGQVRLKWIYYQTRRTRKSAVTELVVTPEDILPEFERLEAHASEMQSIETRTKNPLDLPPSVEHCSAYGGCPYQGNCNLSPFDKMRSQVSQGTNSLLAKLRANKAPAPAAINPPEFQPPPASAEVRDAAQPVVPPLVPASEPLTAPADASQEPTREKRKYTKRTPAPPAVPEIVQEATKAAKNALEEPAATARSVGKPIPMLFVDCGPVGISVVDAHVFILAAKMKLRAAGVEDYRLVKFGEGHGQLAVAIGKELDAQMGPIGYVRLDSHTPEGQIALSEFVERSSLVVR
jgi:hypothetical protein